MKRVPRYTVGYQGILQRTRRYCGCAAECHGVLGFTNGYRGIPKIILRYSARFGIHIGARGYQGLLGGTSRGS